MTTFRITLATLPLHIPISPALTHLHSLKHFYFEELTMFSIFICYFLVMKQSKWFIALEKINGSYETPPSN
jgi:hypothetical protein